MIPAFAAGLSDCGSLTKCAFRLLEAETVGDVSGNGLDLDAHPAASHVAGVLELGDDRLHSVGGDIEPDVNRSIRITEPVVTPVPFLARLIAISFWFLLIMRIYTPDSHLVKRYNQCLGG
jgi:hypothetical protein